MDNIVNLTAEQILTLAERLTWADANGRGARICTGTDENGTWIKWSIAQGMWTPPFYGEVW